MNKLNPITSIMQEINYTAVRYRRKPRNAAFILQCAVRIDQNVVTTCDVAKYKRTDTCQMCSEERCDVCFFTMKQTNKQHKIMIYQKKNNGTKHISTYKDLWYGIQGIVSAY